MGLALAAGYAAAFPVNYILAGKGNKAHPLKGVTHGR